MIDPIQILRDHATVDGDCLTIGARLDRADYVAVAKVLETIGAKWDRRRKGHVLVNGAVDKLEAMLAMDEVIDTKRDLQQFYTPQWLARKAVDLALIDDGCTVLEPSAGRGAILAVAADSLVRGPDGVTRARIPHLLAIEIDPECYVDLLRAAPGADIREADFLATVPDRADDTSPVDRIVMNPPFAKRADCRHVLHAWREWLKPGGRLVAIMSPGWQHGITKIDRAMQQLAEKYGDYLEPIEPGAFAEAGTQVSTVLVALDKPKSWTKGDDDEAPAKVVRKAGRKAKPRPILKEDGYWVPGAEVAKLIRWDLAEAFPGQKFSVRYSTYSMGSSIDVMWTDGPTEAAVSKLIADYGSHGFDGMDDSQYSYHYQFPDGRIVRHGSTHRDNRKSGPPSPEAKPIKLGVGYVHSHRRISEGHVEVVKLAWRGLSDAERNKLWFRCRMGHHCPAAQESGFALDDTLSKIPACWIDTVWHALARKLDGARDKAPRRD